MIERLNFFCVGMLTPLVFVHSERGDLGFAAFSLVLVALNLYVGIDSMLCGGKKCTHPGK
jgi:hypothetical protein